MKARLRVPTKDQYAFIEVEIEPKEQSIDRIITSYFSIKDALEKEEFQRKGGGLETKEFNALLDGYLRDGIYDDAYNQCNQEQKNIIQAIKRSLNRIKYHGNSNADEDQSVHYGEGWDRSQNENR